MHKCTIFPLTLEIAFYSVLFTCWLKKVSCCYAPSLVAQLVKNLPAMQETRLQSLGWEDPLEKQMATHSSMEKPMDRGAWWATVHGVTKVGYNLATKPPP